jgi:hypothetical protein
MTYHLKKEIKGYLQEVTQNNIVEICKQTNNINVQTIIAATRRGRKAISVRLNNNMMTFIFHSPLWKWCEDEQITHQQLSAAIRYNYDYLNTLRDNASKPTYDQSFGNTTPSNKEPTEMQLTCSLRLNKIKNILFQKSYKKQFVYLKIANYFLEQEKTVEQIGKLLKTRYTNVKPLIIETLEIIKDCY